ncbi:MAG TPA: hypothetical protein VK875_02155 [Euzebyales bacterium]|nr:hypothetical protein [Euzebyales bacterium]
MALTLGIGMRIAALSGAELLTLENKPFMDDHIINAVVLVALMICARRRCSSTQDTWPDPRVIGGRYGVGLNDNALWPETMRVSRTAGSRGPWADYITTALAIIRETDRTRLIHHTCRPRPTRPITARTRSPAGRVSSRHPACIIDLKHIQQTSRSTQRTQRRSYSSVHPGLISA